MGIPVETVLDLLRMEQGKHRDQKTLEKTVRRKLHNIMAPYLEDLNYEQAAGWVEDIPDRVPEDLLKQVSEQILLSHASTRERIPFLQEFYEQIFQVTGVPDSILDLACGLHPFGLPWMGLPANCTYHAYDIHSPRVDLINRYFSKLGMLPLAEVQDVLVSPPTARAQIALLFKEAHRMEKRQIGCSRPLWEALDVHYLAVSLPTRDLSGDHDLSEKHRSLVRQVCEGKPWEITEIRFENELVFVIDKEKKCDG
jgi:16S rRNA (guanine(1405)-N(7))-methyltransferase